MIKGTISGKNNAGRNPKSRWHNGKLFHNLAHDHSIIMTKMFNLDQQQHAEDCSGNKDIGIKEHNWWRNNRVKTETKHYQVSDPWFILTS